MCFVCVGGNKVPRVNRQDMITTNGKKVKSYFPSCIMESTQKLGKKKKKDDYS